MPCQRRLSFVHLFPGLSSALTGVFSGRDRATRFAPLPAVNRVERAGESAKEALSKNPADELSVNVAIKPGRGFLFPEMSHAATNARARGRAALHGRSVRKVLGSRFSRTPRDFGVSITEERTKVIHYVFRKRATEEGKREIRVICIVLPHVTVTDHRLVIFFECPRNGGKDFGGA